jgi:hypothetical protein
MPDLPSILPCPVCPVEIQVSEEDPDASLSDLWDHLLGHPAMSAPYREQMFVLAQKNAR